MPNRLLFADVSPFEIRFSLNCWIYAKVQRESLQIVHDGYSFPLHQNEEYPAHLDQYSLSDSSRNMHTRKYSDIYRLTGPERAM